MPRTAVGVPGAEDGCVSRMGFPSRTITSQSPPSIYCSASQCHSESLTTKSHILLGHFVNVLGFTSQLEP